MQYEIADTNARLADCQLTDFPPCLQIANSSLGKPGSRMPSGPCIRGMKNVYLVIPVVFDGMGVV